VSPKLDHKKQRFALLYYAFENYPKETTGFLRSHLFSKNLPINNCKNQPFIERLKTYRPGWFEYCSRRMRPYLGRDLDAIINQAYSSSLTKFSPDIDGAPKKRILFQLNASSSLIRDKFRQFFSSENRYLNLSSIHIAFSFLAVPIVIAKTPPPYCLFIFKQIIVSAVSAVAYVMLEYFDAQINQSEIITRLEMWGWRYPRLISKETIFKAWIACNSIYGAVFYVAIVLVLLLTRRWYSCILFVSLSIILFYAVRNALSKLANLFIARKLPHRKNHKDHDGPSSTSSSINSRRTERYPLISIKNHKQLIDYLSKVSNKQLAMPEYYSWRKVLLYWLKRRIVTLDGVLYSLSKNMLLKSGKDIRLLNDRLSGHLRHIYKDSEFYSFLKWADKRVKHAFRRTQREFPELKKMKIVGSFGEGRPTLYSNLDIVLGIDNPYLADRVKPAFIKYFFFERKTYILSGIDFCHPSEKKISFLSYDGRNYRDTQGRTFVHLREYCSLSLRSSSVIERNLSRIYTTYRDGILRGKKKRLLLKLSFLVRL